MSNFDRKIIKTVYSSGYSQMLSAAKKEYRRYHLPKWLRQYSHLVLIFPLVLLIFLLVWLLIFLYKKWFNRIKSKFLQFNVVAFIGLLVFGILISWFFALGFRLSPSDSEINLVAIRTGIIFTLIIGLPAVNLFFALEFLISRKVQHKYFKTFILFLSTSFLPSLTLWGIIFFVFKGDFKDDFTMGFLMISSLVFLIIGVIRALIHFFIVREKELKIENELKISRLRELKSKAELNALHSRINPHFLYNSLNSIAGLSKINPDKTEHMALSLSKLFRYSINKEQSDWSTIAEEMRMVNIYLDIEKVRFEDRLKFSIDLPGNLEEVQVPRFLIQPLVENAMKHGISKCIEQGVVKVSVNRTNGWLEVSVADNGPDFPDELDAGFGLQSIYDKLEIMYPRGFELHFLKSPDKQILIKLS